MSVSQDPERLFIARGWQSAKQEATRRNVPIVVFNIAKLVRVVPPALFASARLLNEDAVLAIANEANHPILHQRDQPCEMFGSIPCYVHQGTAGALGGLGDTFTLLRGKVARCFVCTPQGEPIDPQRTWGPSEEWAKELRAVIKAAQKQIGEPTIDPKTYFEVGHDLLESPQRDMKSSQITKLARAYSEAARLPDPLGPLGKLRMHELTERLLQEAMEQPTVAKQRKKLKTLVKTLKRYPKSQRRMQDALNRLR